MRDDPSAKDVCLTASWGGVERAACRNSDVRDGETGSLCAQTALGGTGLLSSLAGDLCGRRMRIAIISFTKNPCEVFGAALRLRVVEVAAIAARSHGGGLPRKLDRPVAGA